MKDDDDAKTLHPSQSGVAGVLMVVAVTFSAAALLSGCPLDSSSSGTGGGIDMEIGVDYAVKDGDRLVSTSLPQASIEVIHDFGSETRYAVIHDGTATLFRGQ